MFLYAGIARYFRLFRHFSYRSFLGISSCSFPWRKEPWHAYNLIITRARPFFTILCQGNQWFFQTASMWKSSCKTIFPLSETSFSKNCFFQKGNEYIRCPNRSFILYPSDECFSDQIITKCKTEPESDSFLQVCMLCDLPKLS